MGSLAATDAMSPDISFNIREFHLSEDVLQQVVLWLPVPAALQCGRVSKTFSKATLAAARCAVWPLSIPSNPASVALDHSYCDPVVANEDSYGEDTHLRHRNRRLGTPCIDLRPGGDAVDCSSLTGLLGRAFPNGDSSSVGRAEASHSSITLAERSATVGMTNKEDMKTSSTICRSEAAEPTTGERSLPRGIAVRSARIRDECLQQVLESYGDVLEVLDLAGCRSLSAPRTARSIARSCKGLLSLDLSGARCEGLRHTASPPSLLLNVASSPHNMGINDLRDDTLTSLLASVGAGLEFLRLRDCAHITDDGIHAVASSCSKLRELDIGTQSSSSNITERSLVHLSSARCAASLVYLGLRNRRRVGLHGGLFNLISQFPNLRRLDLAGLDCINDDALGTLASALTLTHIDLSRATIVSNAGVSALANGCPELECISLHGTAVSDNSVTALCSSCLRLRAVNISMTRVTARSLRTLAGKDSLRWVNLRCCPSLDGDDAFRSMENLRRLLSAPKLPRDRGVVLGLELPKGGQTGWKGSPLRRDNRKVELDASLRGVQKNGGIERAGRGRDVTGFGHAGLAAHTPGARDISKVINRQMTDGNSSSGGGQLQPVRLPVGIGDLSLTGKQRGGAETRRRAEQSTVDISRIDNAEMGGIVAFDWDAVPRGRSLGDLGTWRGFRGLSGDLVKHVLCELHPFANVNLVGRRRSGLNPSRKNSHGYLVHTSKYALSWVEIEVDEQGCVV